MFQLVTGSALSSSLLWVIRCPGAFVLMQNDSLTDDAFCVFFIDYTQDLSFF